MNVAFHSTALSIQMLRTRRRGFSLIELLVVTAIIGMLSAASVVAISSMNSSTKMSQAGDILSDYAKMASVRAITKNQEVWVGLYQGGTGLELLSFDGDPESGQVANRRQFLAQVRLTSIASVESAGLSLSTGKDGQDMMGVTSLTRQVGSQGGVSLKVEHWMIFTARGEMRIQEGSSTRMLLIGLSSINSTDTKAMFPSVVQITGLTGSTKVVRQ